MQSSGKGFFGSTVMLSALVGFIVLFSACAAGYDYFTAGRAKASEAVWTGDKAGTSIAGFIKGAEAKALKSPQNPNPEVLPAQHNLNSFYLKHTKAFSWMVVLGELLMPIGVLFFLVVKFPTSRFFLMAIAGLAAFMNFTYLAEGTSSTNPPMVFMWLTIIWAAGLIPAGALFYAIDLRRVFGKAPVEAYAAVDLSVGQWLFFAAMLLVTLVAGLLMYAVGTLIVIVVVAAAIAAALYGINIVIAGRQKGSASVSLNQKAGTTTA